MEVLKAVVPIFGIIILGYILIKIRFLSQDFINELNKFVYFVALPSLLFYKISKSSFEENLNINLILAAIISTIIVISISYIVCKILNLKDTKKGVFIQATFRGNVAYIGFAISLAIFGGKALEVAGLFAGFYIPLTNIFAILILTYFGKANVKCYTLPCIAYDILKNPIVLSSAAGIFFSKFNLFIPEILDKFLDIISCTALPLALLVIGGNISFEKIKEEFFIPSLTSFFKLILLPAILLFITKFINIKSFDLKIGVILLSTPTAITSFVFAKELKGDEDLASSAIVFSTALSVITIPLWLLYLQKY